MKCCQTKCSYVKLDWALQTMSSLSAETHWADENIMLPFTEGQLIAVCKLLNREWFRRLWIWQEVRHANSVIVMCGTHEMAYIDVTDTAYCICYKSNPKFFSEFMTARQQDILQSLCRQLDYQYFQHIVNYT
jgi:hypothetical protein